MLGLILSTLLLTGCGSTPRFDSSNAYDLLVKQTDFGPRVPGTEAHKQAIEFFKSYLKERGATIILDTFSFTDTLKNITISPATNIVARFYPELKQRIVLGAHFDSRPFCDKDPDTANLHLPLPGANDGASGVAILLELANVLQQKRPEIGADLVLFDLEDWGEEGNDDYFCIGSKHFAGQLNRNSYRYAVIIDMIGDANQEVFKESTSNYYARPIVDLVWSKATKLNIKTFYNKVKYGIYDDHLPILERGIPSIVVIDFDYPYWHTREDTADKCSPGSLGNIGKILVALLYDQ